MTLMTTKIKMLTAVKDTVDCLAEKMVEMDANLMNLAKETVGTDKLQQKTQTTMRNMRNSVRDLKRPMTATSRTKSITVNTEPSTRELVGPKKIAELE